MPVESRAVILTEQKQPMQVETISVNDPAAGQVRVKLSAAGVCHSDLSLANGTLAARVPVVLGHEGAGVVESVGDGVTDLAVGDNVLMVWAPACRNCYYCKRGEPFHCMSGNPPEGRTFATREDGTEIYAGLGTATFSEYSTLPATSVVKLDSDVNLGHAAVIGCAMMTGIGAVINTAKVPAGDSVAVIGLGGVGLSAVQGAKLAGANPIIAIDSSSAKEDLARAAGATHFVLSNDETAKAVRELTDGRGVDFSFEVVGISPTIRLAYDLARRGGTATVVGAGSRTDNVSFNALELFYMGKTIHGSMFGGSDPAIDGPELLKKAADGQIDPHALITDEITLDQVPDAFERMHQGVGGRSIIRYE